MSMQSKSFQSSEQFIQSQGFTYFAFISYRHKDAKWAVWLKRRLQSYRLPTKTHERHNDLPTRLCPVFLDKDHMTPGNLQNQERLEVQSAKYLIVICSRNASKESKNIDDEIQFFLDGGGDSSRIIPFIVDDAPHPEEECFPLRLRELCREAGNIIGANVHDSGKNNAVLKVVAYMHGIKLEELESEEKRIRKRRLTIRIAAAAFVLIALCITGYKIWDYYVPKYSYYLDYTEVYGLPQGIEKLSKKDTQSLHAFYTIISRYGKVQELRHENAYGMLVERENTTFSEKPARIAYEYSQDGTLSQVTYYDTDDHPSDTRVYSGANLKTLDIRKAADQNSDTYDSSQSMNSHTLGFMDNADSVRERRSNVIRYLIDYDDNGYVAEIRYACNTSNSVGTDADGISGIRFMRDSLGRVIRESYLTYIGSGDTATDPDDFAIIGTRTGLASIEFRYDQFNCVQTRFLNADDQLVYGMDNVCLIQTDYQNHNLVKESFYDANGDSMFGEDGYVSYETEYDARGNEIKTVFYGLEGEPAAAKDGYASLTKEYDDQGNMTKISFYGSDGAPATHSKGYASCEMVYDQHRNCIKTAFYGLSGEPVMQKSDGCASWECEYDEKGNLIKVRFYDTAGNLVLNSYGYAISETQYDAQGNEIGWRSYGTDEKPVLNSYGYHIARCEFDANGNMKEASFFDTDGSPIIQSEGYASWTAKYDARGNEIEVNYFDADGNAVLAERGYSRSTSEFDELGNLTEMRYYGTDGELIVNSDGYASCVNEYDEHGNEIKTSYYGVDGKPVLIKDGYAVWTSEYDERGNETKAAFFGTDQKPIITAFEYAFWISRYDERGKRIESSYYDTKGQPILVDKGYASWKSEFDDRGNEIKTSYYGADRELVLIDDGYAYVEIEYNRMNVAIKMSYFGTDGKPVLCSEGYASWEYEYDEQGRATAIVLHDESGAVINRITS